MFPGYWDAWNQSWKAFRNCSEYEDMKIGSRQISWTNHGFTMYSHGNALSTRNVAVSILGTVPLIWQTAAKLPAVSVF